MNRKRLTLVLVAALALGTGTALAGGSTNSPGSGCVAGSGTLTPTTTGGAQNNGSAAAVAVCPVDRSVTSPASTHFSASVWVQSSSSQSNLCCWVTSLNPNGGSSVNSGFACAAKGSGAQQLQINSITDSGTFSQWFVECIVPAVDSGNASAILSYRSVQS